MTQKQFRRFFRFSSWIFEIPNTQHIRHSREFSTHQQPVIWLSKEWTYTKFTQSSHKSTVNIPDQPSLKINGLAYNTRSRSHSMPEEMPTTSLNELEIGSSTLPTVEDTIKKPAEPSDKSVTGRTTKVQCSLKISQHPLFDKENHPTKRANTLEDLQDNINDDKYSSWWFEFLSKAMDYDRRLFDQFYKIKQSLKRV